MSAPIDATGRLTATFVGSAHLSGIEGGGHGNYHGHCDEDDDALVEAIRRAWPSDRSAAVPSLPDG